MAITLRTVAGTALSHTQVDTNFCSLFYSASVSGQTLTLYSTGSAGLGVPVASSSLTLTGLNFWTASGANLTRNSDVIVTGSLVNGYPGLVASANYTHAEGRNTQATADLAHTEGRNTIASGYASHAEGFNTSATATGSHSEGLDSFAQGNYSHAEGNSNYAIGYASHAEGSANYSNGDFSHAEGNQTTAYGTFSHAEGYNTSTGINTAYFLTSSSLASGSFDFSSSYGDLTANHNPGDIFYLDDTAYDAGYGPGIYTISHSLFTGGKTRVYLTDVSIVTSQAIGGNVTWGSGNWSGDQTIRGDYAHSEGGGNNIAFGIKSHVEGNNSEAWGNSAHAEGWQTKALSILSHTEGTNTATYGNYAHAEGSNTNALGLASHAEGFYAAAGGMYSHAEGANTQALGLASHAEGYLTIASGSYQHVQGQCNISSSAQSAFIIGNGTSAGSRSNLVFASGSEFQVTGSLKVSGSVNVSGSFVLDGHTQFNHGMFYHTASQSVGNGTSGSATLSTTAVANGVSITNGSRITIVNPGYYNIQFSAQLAQGAGTANFYVWFKKNGVNMSNTTSVKTLQNNTNSLMTVDIIDYASTAGDYYEIVHQSNAANSTLEYIAGSGNYPASPPIIVTVQQVR